MKSSKLGNAVIVLGVGALLAAAWLVSSYQNKKKATPTPPGESMGLVKLTSTSPATQAPAAPVCNVSPSNWAADFSSSDTTLAQARAYSITHPCTLVTWAGPAWQNTHYFARGKDFGVDFVDALHTAQYGSPYW